MMVVALTHPQEVGGDLNGLAVILTDTSDGPLLVLGGPTGGFDPVLVADVLIELIHFDHLAHVLQNFLGTGDRRANPGLKTITKSV